MKNCGPTDLSQNLPGTFFWLYNLVDIEAIMASSNNVGSLSKFELALSAAASLYLHGLQVNSF